MTTEGEQADSRFFAWFDVVRDVDALGFLKLARDERHACPWGDDQGRPKPSNGQLRRWLTQKSVVINGQFLAPEDKVGAVWQLVFFPNNEKKRTSIVDEPAPID